MYQMFIALINISSYSEKNKGSIPNLKKGSKSCNEFGTFLRFGTEKVPYGSFFSGRKGVGIKHILVSVSFEVHWHKTSFQPQTLECKVLNFMFGLEYIHLYTHLSTNLAIKLSVYLSIYLPIYLSIYLSTGCPKSPAWK